MGRWLLALLLVAAGSPHAAAHDALGAIDDCVGQLDRALDVGYQRIAARCPDLTPSLTQSPWAAWLPRDWKEPANLLSADGLAELKTLLEREPGVSSKGPTPAVEHVAAVLAKVTQSGEARGGWWTRLKQWLREALSPHPQPPGEGWWRRLFGEARLSQVLVDAIAWGALLLVFVLAAVVVANELRVAGLIRGRRRAPARARAAAGETSDATLEDLERASHLEQLPLVLELIARRLAAQERLPPARSLTVRELTRAAQLPAESDRAHLRELTAACEWVRFSGRQGDPQALAAALAHGRALLAALEAPAPQPGSAG